MSVKAENHPVGERPPPLLRKEGSTDHATSVSTEQIVCDTPDETFALGERLGRSLDRGDLVLLYGSLGVGKTLLTKGILNGLGFDIDEVTSPSFTLVNLYKTDIFDVYHIDLWRLEGKVDAANAVGLEEILENENAVTIVEWADRLGGISFPHNIIRVKIEGDGEESRAIEMIKALTAQKI